MDSSERHKSSTRSSSTAWRGGRVIPIVLCLCAVTSLGSNLFNHHRIASTTNVFSEDNFVLTFDTVVSNNDDGVDKERLHDTQAKKQGNDEDYDDAVKDETKMASGKEEDDGTLTANAGSSPTPEELSGMNILILYPDDWRWDSIGEESSQIQTPFLDSFVKENIRFRQNAVTTSICWQSRATLFTGQWASRHRSYKLKCPHFTVGKAWNQTWAGMLRNAGYYLGHIGKWQYHNSDLNSRFDRGEYFEGHHWYARGGKQIAGEDLARMETIRFLQERPKDKPFAATVAFYPPKPVGSSGLPGKQYEPKNETRAMYENITIPEPFGATENFHQLPKFLQNGIAAGRWEERYSTPFHYQESMKNMYALITQIDQSFKEIIDEVKRLGLYDNTMIVITADNGMFNGAHGLAGKWFPYQESIRVPLIIHDPRMPKEKQGTVDESFTLNVDLAETILGAAGLKPNERMQGRDISDIYLDNYDDSGNTALEREPWRDEFFYEFTYLEESSIPSSNALVRKKWKFIDWYAFNETQLFDLEKDPLELNDVKGDPANKGIVNEMKGRLVEMREKLKEPEIGCETGKYFLESEEAKPR